MTSRLFYQDKLVALLFIGKPYIFAYNDVHIVRVNNVETQSKDKPV